MENQKYEKHKKEVIYKIKHQKLHQVYLRCLWKDICKKKANNV